MQGYKFDIKVCRLCSIKKGEKKFCSELEESDGMFVLILFFLALFKTKI